IAIVLFFGVVPSLDELLRIAAYFGAALLLSLAFFAVAMAASTLARSSSMAVLYALGIVVVLVGLASFSYQIVSLVVGPAPDYGGPIVYASGGTGTDLVKADLAWSNGTGVSSAEGSPPPDVSAVSTQTPVPLPEPILPGETGGSDEWRQWEERQQLAQGALNAISPITNFQYVIANALVSDTSSWIAPLPIDAKYMPYSEAAKTNVWDALGSVWVNIVVLLAETLAAFGVAYVKFLRSDIR
ncbi:MAG TPA: ABC transporter permease subunit, partial [Methanocella sp.]|nr:ABC transporter permease subunit [Methanocella sp.]